MGTQVNTNSQIRLNRIMAFIVGFAVNFDYFSFAGGLSIVSLIIICYFFFVLSSFKVKTINKADYKFIWPPIIYLFILMVLNVFNLNSVNSSIVPISFVFCLLLFFVVFIHVKNDSKSVVYITNGVALGGIAMTICFNLGVGVEYESNRLTMFGGNPNNLGCFMCVTAVIVLYSYILKDSFHLRAIRFLFIPLLLPIFQVVFATASRTAFLTLALVILLSFLFVPVKKKITKVLLIIVFAIIVYISYKSLEDYETLYARLFLLAEGEDISSGREGRWEQLLLIAKQNPFGIGQTGYSEVAQRLFSSADIEGYASPHNVLIEVLLYTGFGGLFLMSFFWFHIFNRTRQYLKENNDLLLLLIMVVFLIQMLFGQILIFRTAWLFWGVIAGSTISGTRLYKRLA